MPKDNNTTYFSCYWAGHHNTDDSHRICNLTEILLEWNFSEKESNEIKKLEIGQTYRYNVISEDIYITRIANK